MGDRNYSNPVIKTLFAMSGNVCYYEGCNLKLTDRSWPSVRGQIVHIYGLRPTSARFVASMSKAERNAIENLMLMCPNHHVLIDDLERDQHPPERLLEMKARHERQIAERGAWKASDTELASFADAVREQLLRDLEEAEAEYRQEQDWEAYLSSPDVAEDARARAEGGDEAEDDAVDIEDHVSDLAPDWDHGSDPGR